MDKEHARHHDVNYLMVFVTLCCLTALSVAADVIQIDNRVIVAVIVLAISTTKALCVMLYFMHLKFERNWKYLILAPTTILALGLPLALLPDVGVHYYSVDVPQNDVTLSSDEHNSNGSAPTKSSYNSH